MNRSLFWLNATFCSVAALSCAVRAWLQAVACCCLQRALLLSVLLAVLADAWLFAARQARLVA